MLHKLNSNELPKLRYIVKELIIQEYENFSTSMLTHGQNYTCKEVLRQH